MKQFFMYVFLLLSTGYCLGQSDTAMHRGVRNNVYRYKPAVDLPLTAAAIAFDMYAFGKIYNKNAPTPQAIDQLRKENINGFDRWAADVYRGEGPAETSDLLFYGSMPLPLLLLIDHDIRKDAGTVGLIYLEAIATNGIFYTGSALTFDRYRPFAYVNTSNGMGDQQFRQDKQLNGNAKNAFLGGHPSLVATSTFFIAKVYADYHPTSRNKWIFYTGAALATGTTAYLRHLGGRHFPSDLIAGSAAGTLSGILIPHFHKRKQFKNPNLSVLPFAGESNGLVLRYKW